MAQSGNTALRFVAGALLTLTLLASGFLLGITQLPASGQAREEVFTEPELVELAGMLERMELSLGELLTQLQDQLEELEAAQAQLRLMEQSLAQLAEQNTRQERALEEIGQELQALAAQPAPIEVQLAQAEVSAEPVQLAPAGVSAEQVQLVEAEPVPELPPAQPDLSKLALVAQVKRSESIWTIANRFQSPPSQEFIARIIELNQVDPYRLQIGQDLLIPLAEGIFTIVEVE